RRDAERRPWAGGHLRMNDLHTASFTAELAALLGAGALINEAHDRNEVDLNRVSEAHQRAPWFLERLADLLDTAVRRHGRATLLALHGWNVVQPVVDLGLGCTPGENPFVVGRAAAVSPAFAASALPRLVEACRAHGIAATVGARYPARHRENLIQLFTRRYAEDGRPQVRALAALAPLVDAVQLELGIALRWPGTWRARLVAACAEALPALLAAPHPAGAPPSGTGAAEAAPPVPRRLEFARAALSGPVGLDASRTGRPLLLPERGRSSARSPGASRWAACVTPSRRAASPRTARPRDRGRGCAPRSTWATAQASPSRSGSTAARRAASSVATGGTSRWRRRMRRSARPTRRSRASGSSSSWPTAAGSASRPARSTACP